MGKRRSCGVMVDGGCGDTYLLGGNSITELIDVDRQQHKKQQTNNILHTFNHTMWSPLCLCNLS